jgi:hypothetical protein
MKIDGKKMNFATKYKNRNDIYDFYYVALRTSKSTSSLQNIIPEELLYNIIFLEQDTKIFIVTTLEKLCELIELLRKVFNHDDGFYVSGEGYTIQLCIEYVIECIPAMILYEYTQEEINIISLNKNTLSSSQEQLYMKKCRRDYDVYINKCEEIEQKKRDILKNRYIKRNVSYHNNIFTDNIIDKSSKYLDYIITLYSQYTMIDTINLGDYIYISLGKWKKCVIYAILDEMGIIVKFTPDYKEFIPKQSSGIYISDIKREKVLRKIKKLLYKYEADDLKYRKENILSLLNISDNSQRIYNFSEILWCQLENFINPNEVLKNSPLWITAPKSIKNKFIKKYCVDIKDFYMDDSHKFMISTINNIKKLLHAIPNIYFYIPQAIIFCYLQRRSENYLSDDVIMIIVDFIIL